MTPEPLSTSTSRPQASHFSGFVVPVSPPVCRLIMLPTASYRPAKGVPLARAVLRWRLL